MKESSSKKVLEMREEASAAVEIAEAEEEA